MEASSVKTGHVHPPPTHVAIIMDGNGRWAKARGLPRAAGHKRGADVLQRIIRGAGDAGVQYLTLFGFSSENWRRPTPEIDDLMRLLRFYLKNEVGKLDREGVRLQVIGDRHSLADDIVDMIERAEAATAGNTRLVLTIALSYGSRAEITRAVRQLAEKVRRGDLAADDISEDMVADHLYTATLPDPDLLIRTSGEQRISNFLLWQIAYSELVFMAKPWPDFTVADLQAAIDEYHSRERRYGATGG